jgi:flavin-dependent dehydrogenase
VDPTWDVIVVGGGPAGGLAAHELARAGLATLLVERARMPRAKVCGGCLDADALASLSACGLAELPGRLGAVPLHTVDVRARGRSVRLPLHGAAVTRATLDAALLDAAAHAGARVLTGVEAQLLPADTDPTTRGVALRGDGLHGACLHGAGLRGARPGRIARARLVLAADGLAGRLLEGRPAPSAPGARLGAGVVLPAADGPWPPGTLAMACGRGGYVGITRADGDALCIAAALDPAAVKAVGGPGAAAARILADAGHDAPPDLAGAAWRATPTLSRRARRLGAHRVLALGDAAGFVEPFTGQGMAWAFAAARAVTPLARRAVELWHEGLVDEWSSTWTRDVARRQRTCRGAAWLLRRPALARLGILALGAQPGLARGLIARLLPGTT